MKEKLENLIKETMKEIIKLKKEGKDCSKLTIQLETYREIKSELVKQETSDQKPKENLDLFVLELLAKNHEKSIEAYKQANRNDLLEIEEEQLKIIKSFLPEEATQTEIAETIGQYIVDNGLEGNIPKSKMGECINYVKNTLSPKKVDGKLVATLVKNLLL